MTHRRLKKGEVVKQGDEIDRCVDAWRDDPVWEPVHPNDVGGVAPDPQYPSHRQYRRDVEMEEHNDFVESLKEGVEFQPLRDFIDQLKEPPPIKAEDIYDELQADVKEYDGDGK